jgi:hypothetical protein
VNNVNIHYDPKSWSTQYTADDNALTRSIFANLTEQDFLPTYAMDMIFSGDDIGLGVMDSEQLGPVTFVSSMSKAIRYALHGVPQREGGRLKLPRGIRKLYGPWKTSQLSISRLYWKLATALIDRCNEFKIESQHNLTLHDVTMTMRASNIQKILLAPAKKERLQNLVTEPSLVCLTHAIDPLITPPPPGRPFATSPTLKTPTWWAEEYNIPFLLKGIMSNVESEKGQDFLNLPRILYCLKSPEFVVAMQRHLRIPIHRK